MGVSEKLLEMVKRNYQKMSEDYLEAESKVIATVATAAPAYYYYSGSTPVRFTMDNEPMNWVSMDLDAFKQAIDPDPNENEYGEIHP